MAAATHQHLVDVALDLFYQHGFHAVGVDSILKSAGVAKATFYNHFEGKDDLVLAVIEKRDQWWRQTFAEELQKRAGDDPVAQLRAIFDVLREWFDMNEFKGCLFINAASAFPAANDPAHKAAKANVDAIRDKITVLAARAGIPNPHVFAQQLNLIIEGAICTEVIDRNHEAADTAAQIANVLIDRALAAAEGQ